MIGAVVLAAGESRRMGVQKLLLPFGTTTVIGHIVDQLLQSTLDEIYVVVGHEGSRIAEELCGRRVCVVTNPNYRTGMLSSVRCGLQALPQRCGAIMVLLGDQPAITSALVDTMVQAFPAAGKGILVPLCRGKRGHPILFSEHYRHEILTRYDHLGLRGLLYAHPDDICELSVSTAEVLSDIDYPEDYRQQLARLKENSGE